jgi:FKBP-type peptidyl-prolyl cis-trans isomerase
MNGIGRWGGLWAVVLVVLTGVGCQASLSDEQARLARSNLTELLVQDLGPGAGETAMAGRTVSVHYTGWLYHPTNADHRGEEFDSSVRRAEPFQFRLGAGEVIPGWDQGVSGMKVGGKRRLTIPPRLAYGANGVAGVIPPDATLVFEIELLSVR